MKKLKKSLTGWADSNWLKRFYFHTRRQYKNKNDKEKFGWIDELRHSDLNVPSICRNKRPIIGPAHPYPSSDKSTKVRITIEEI